VRASWPERRGGRGGGFEQRRKSLTCHPERRTAGSRPVSKRDAPVLVREGAHHNLAPGSAGGRKAAIGMVAAKAATTGGCALVAGGFGAADPRRNRDPAEPTAEPGARLFCAPSRASGSTLPHRCRCQTRMKTESFLEVAGVPGGRGCEGRRTAKDPEVHAGVNPSHRTSGSFAALRRLLRNS
jgi:hypothetical protein